MPCFKGLVYTLQIYYNNVVDFCSPAVVGSMGIFVPPVQPEVFTSADCRLQVWMLSN